jgi:hypothetical protein
VVHAAATIARCPYRLRAVVIVLVVVLLALPAGRLTPARDPGSSSLRFSAVDGPTSNSSPVANFSASIDRLVDLLGIAGSGLLALVWARVALSWFSHDVTKKVQAKERARDALIGTLLFVAALTGLIWGLAHWVLTGT